MKMVDQRVVNTTPCQTRVSHVLLIAVSIVYNVLLLNCQVCVQATRRNFYVTMTCVSSLKIVCDQLTDSDFYSRKIRTVYRGGVLSELKLTNHGWLKVWKLE